jgi:signal transduction histidine kinase
MTARLRPALIAAAIAMVVGEIAIFYVPRPPPPPVFAALTITTGAAFLAAGIAARDRWPGNRVGLLFTITGYLWLLTWLDHLPNSLAFTYGNLSWTWYQAPLVHLALAWPGGRLRTRFERGVVITGYAWIVVSNVAALMFWNPAFSGCDATCPANLLLVDSSRPVYDAINAVAAAVSIAMTVTVLTLVIRHWRAARGWSRRAMLPLVWISFAVASFLAVQTVTSNLNLPVSQVLLSDIAPLILLAGPALVVISTLLSRSARGAVGTAIIDLAPGATPGRLRDALAQALGDSTLQLAFRSTDGAGYRDTDGRRVDPARPEPGRTMTPLTEAGDAVLVHDQGLEQEPQLVRLTASAASMALEHARLQAAVQAQLEQVRASRARIVEASDAERRRLERDLHDGAQQRLVTLSLALGMAREHAADADPALQALIESARKEAREALLELRELGRGIHPAVLTETGLPGAIQALAERSPVSITITEVPPRRFPAAIEATAYFVVSEALANVAKHARADAADVTIRELPGRLVVQVADDGAGGARAEGGSGLRGLADRVASVGGVLRLDSPPGCGTRLEADIPCT